MFVLYGRNYLKHRDLNRVTKNAHIKPGMVVHVRNPQNLGEEAGGFQGENQPGQNGKICVKIKTKKGGM